MTLPAGYELETLPAGAAEGTPAAEEIVGFWALHGAFAGESALERLPSVVCLLRDGHGNVAATAGAVPGEIPEIGGRRFWLLRCLTPSRGARDAIEPVLLCAWGVLAARRTDDPALGVCLLLSDREIIARRDEAVLPRSRMLFAGWAAAGEQLRLRYFEGAKVL